MAEHERGLEASPSESHPRQHHPMLDEEAYEKRKKAARIFAMLGFVVFAAWGASVFQQMFPHHVELRYIYKGVPSPGQLTKVLASVHGEDGLKARVAFYHHEPVPGGGERYFRQQKLSLGKGAYRVKVVLRYKQGPPKTMTTRLLIRETGRYYVYLKRAE